MTGQPLRATAGSSQDAAALLDFSGSGIVPETQKSRPTRQGRRLSAMLFRQDHQPMAYNEGCPAARQAQTAQPALISRDEALALGLPGYFTGVPCRRGHVDKRYALTRGCYACVRQCGLKYRRKNAKPRATPMSAEEKRTRLAAASRAWRAKNKSIFKRKQPGNRQYNGKWGRPDQRCLAREAAIEAGLTRYYTGSPCHRGHLSERLVSSSNCVQCVAERSRAKNAARRAEREASNPPLTKAERQDRLLVRKRHHAAKRHALKMGLLGRVERGDIERIGERQKWKCAGCGRSVRKKYHVDHIMPLSRGGLHDRCNLQILCPSCNLDKRAKHPVDWALSMGRLV